MKGILLGLSAGVAALGMATSANAALLYDLTFDNQTLDNSGTAGGAATVSTTAAPDPVYTSSTPNGSTYALDLVARSTNPKAEYLTLPASTGNFSLSSTDGSDRMTMAAWIYWNGNIQTNTIISKGGGASGGTGWSLYIDGTTNKLTFAYANGGVFASAGTRTSTSSVPIGQWVHVAFEWAGNASLSVTGQTSGQNLKFFINGADAGLNSALSSSTAYLGANTSAIIVGDRFANNNNPLNGSVDDVRLYDTVLSDGQVAALVPEPTTMSVIGLAGLLMLGARQRKPMVRTLS